MRSVDPNNWFWSPERLTLLVGELKEIARRDGNMWYFGHEAGLATQAYHHLHRAQRELTQGQFGDAVKILVHFGVLDPGTPSIKLPGYRRGFYPDKLPQLTWEHIDQYREARTKK